VPRAATSSPPAKATPADSNAETDDDAALQTIDPADVIRVNSNLVPVAASVVDVQGKAITDLKLEDFELRVDGQPKQISEIGFSNTPVRLVMLFDNSSSLSAAREFEKKAAIRFFRNVLRPIDEAAIFSISTVPILEQSLTSNVQTLVRTIEHFGKPEGATALFDAIAQAAAYLRPLQGRKVIVIVSDGADTISDMDFDSTLRQAQAADCQIYAVQTGQLDYDMQTGEFKNANVRDLAAERRMQEMALQTGGAVYVPHGTADLDTAFAQISADLAQQYILSYYPTDDKRDGRFRVISLRVATRSNVRVRARKGYYAPKG
jgi:Ca-activated chloride channel family protein